MSKRTGAPRGALFALRGGCVAAGIALTIAGCDAGDAATVPYPPAAAEKAEAPSAVGAAAALGRKIFFDASLSASGRMACASCHSPEHGYGPPNDLPAQFGGAALDVPGLRAVPSLRYVLNRTPRWIKQYQANPLERLTETDAVPTGGFSRDGRFDTLHDQAAAPLLAANEMANASPAAVVDKLRAAPYAAEFRQVYGASALDDATTGFAKALDALEHFELEDPSLRPYTSKFDRYLKGEVQLSAQETHGLQLFADPKKGNCAACHIAAKGADGSLPLFTDFSFSTLAAPRNPKIAANADPAFFDLGLCGPLRTDQTDGPRYCGMFKTPSLRNVASRGVFLHNGVFTKLADVVRFYAERDVHPEKWFTGKQRGRRAAYDDLPVRLRDNADAIDAPLDRERGDAPALTEAEVRDIVAFLGTLTDADVVGVVPSRTGVRAAARGVRVARK